MPIKGSATSSLARMQGKFIINIETGCHIWNAGTSSQGRYPTIGRQGSKQVDYAHVIAWEAINGQTPSADSITDGSDRWEHHHKCNNNRCVNGAHVELVTRRQHAQLHKLKRDAKKLALQVAA
jgi:hypothetical protein